MLLILKFSLNVLLDRQCIIDYNALSTACVVYYCKRCMDMEGILNNQEKKNTAKKIKSNKLIQIMQDSNIQFTPLKFSHVYSVQI